MIMQVCYPIQTGTYVATLESESMDSGFQHQEPKEQDGSSRHSTDAVQLGDQSDQNVCDNKKEYKCHLCNREFGRRANLKRHLMSHTGEKPFDCPHCDKKFSLKSTLHNHVRLHTGEKPYTCETCQKTFRQRSNYIVHRKLHTGEKDFVCEVCGRQFIQKGHFELHLLSHSSTKAFVCQQCDKRFSQLVLLKRHSIIHKEDKERKIHVCHVCDKKFCASRSLELHLKAHAGIKDFQCNRCGKTFQQRNALNRHIRQNKNSFSGDCQHKGKQREVIYECNFCLRTFPKKGRLRCHMYSHTGEKPYECKDCNKRFTTKSSLNIHVKLYCKGNEAGTSTGKPQENEAELLDCKDTMVNPESDYSSNSEKDATACLLAAASGASKKSVESLPMCSQTALSSQHTISSSSGSTRVSSLEKMTEHLSICHDSSSFCSSDSPSKISTLTTEMDSVLLSTLKREKEEESTIITLSVSSVVHDNSASWSGPSIESSLSDQVDVKEEIEIFHEEID
ncbi:zinc finger protein OZF-like isoform X1 [Macrobrachium rosenbergii]|uniref:zinc finger protein OZF-like isoform X1 n=2 Tax=Macrobrachium rosenbergii TaxID=79674 RepID=UPI0034D771E4